MAEKIEIKLKSFDYRMLDKSAAEIVNTAKHVDKKSMDQFELRTHSRLILIKEATPQTVDDLKRLNLPAGVEIAVHL